MLRRKVLGLVTICLLPAGALNTQAGTGNFIELAQATREKGPRQAPASEVDVEAPDTAVAGSVFTVTWDPTVQGRDYIMIVPAGSGDDVRGNHVRARSGSPHDLRAPGQPGLYEVRYVSSESRAVLGRDVIEIIEPDVSLSAPDRAVTGSRFQVSWGNAVDGRDYITIVPADADDDERGNHVRARSGSPSALTAPSAPGLYEVRYILDEGRRVLARVPIEITEAEVQLSVPDTAVAGSRFEVSWSKTIDGRDYITIVPAGSDGDERGNHVRARSGSPSALTAPSDPGLYEVRYVLNEGRRVLTSVSIEVTEPEITLDAPETVRANTPVRIGWTGEAPQDQDYITIVPAGAVDDARGEHRRVRSGNPVELTAPADPGMYEARYILNEGRRVLARAAIEVVAETAPLDAGAGLEAPERAAPGATVVVTWTLEASGSDHRITIARADQPDFTWIKAQSASNGPPLRFTVPEESGFYEFRYLDVDGRKVLGRVILEVR